MTSLKLLINIHVTEHEVTVSNKQRALDKEVLINNDKEFVPEIANKNVFHSFMNIKILLPVVTNSLKLINKYALFLVSFAGIGAD